MQSTAKVREKRGSLHLVPATDRFPGKELFAMDQWGGSDGCVLEPGSKRFACKDCQKCVWGDSPRSDKEYEDIVNINVFAGQQSGNGLEVRIDLRGMKASWTRYTSAGDAVHHEPGFKRMDMVLQIESVGNFVQGLKDCGLLNWGQRYELDEGDATGWLVQIQFDDSRLKKSGSNSFPRKWPEFCQLIGAFVGMEFSNI
jgi:hypothetical protein